MKSASILWLCVLAAGTVSAQDRSERQQGRPRIDVQTVAIDARINPMAQTLDATAKVTFIPVDTISSVTFELNNALDLTRVTDGEGRQITASRFQEDQSVRLNLPQSLPKGQPGHADVCIRGKADGTGRVAGIRH